MFWNRPTFFFSKKFPRVSRNFYRTYAAVSEAKMANWRGAANDFWVPQNNIANSIYFADSKICKSDLNL